MDLIVFAAFALASQLALVFYFVARRVRPAAADRHGWIAYAFGIMGLPVGVVLLVLGAPWQLFVGPPLFAAWAAVGAWADRLVKVEWRRPVRWSVFGPYVSLYLAAQMFLWWPMWDRWRAGWYVYLGLFAVNTLLNLAGHAGSARASAPA